MFAGRSGDTMKSMLALLLVVAACAAAADDPQAGPSGPPTPPAQNPPPGVTHQESLDDPLMPSAANPLETSVPAVVQRNGFLSVQVNVTALGQNIVGDAANEPSIAVNPLDPRKMAIGWRQFDTIQSNFRQAGWGFSQDGGKHWTFVGRLDPGVFRSDPVLAANADGVFFYDSLTSDFTCDIFRSFDGGVHWTGPFPAGGGDKAWMTVDTTSGPGRGNLYQAWSTAAGCCGTRIFNRSTNGGTVWSEPIGLPSSPRWGTMAVGPDGELYICGGNGANGVVVVKSVNAQLPGAAPAFGAANFANIGGFPGGFGGGPNPGGLLGQAWIDVDRSDGPRRGWVYVLSSMTPAGGGDPLDIGFARSRDGGLHWDPPVRINDDVFGNGAWQWFGTMSVAPNGRIDAVWNDTREHPATLLSVLYYSFSLDGGETWSPNVAMTPEFDPRLGYPNQNKIGDYYHMVSHNSASYLAYSATFNGEQDVYFLRLSADCNSNGIADSEDLAGGTSTDCDDDDVPDECEGDCDADGIADACKLAVTHDCCGDAHGPGCNDPAIQACVCAIDAYCCTTWWDRQCAAHVKAEECGYCGSADCETNGIPDECEPFVDCNSDAVRDACDIAAGASFDCDNNGTPDECQPYVDCNGNSLADYCDLSAGTSHDCDTNGVPDECDIAAGRQSDCQPNGVPDACDIQRPDHNCCSARNASGCSDSGVSVCVCAIDPSCCTNRWTATCAFLADALGCTDCPSSSDCNSDGVPDECNVAAEHDCCDYPHGEGCSDTDIAACVCAHDAYCCTEEWDRACAQLVLSLECGVCPSTDCDFNGVLDSCDLEAGVDDCNSNGRPDSCDRGELFASLSQPENVTECPLAQVTISVEVPPTATAFQWYRGATPLNDGPGLAGTHTTTLSLYNILPAAEGFYRLAVSVGCIEVFSTPAELAVMPTTLSIAQQPVASLSLCGANGQSAVFVCKASDEAGTEYSWQHDGSALVNGGRVMGADTSQLQILNVTPADAGYYRCRATNACHADVSSDPARGRLIVIDPVFTELPVGACVVAGGTAVFDATAQSPLPVQYAWYRNGTLLGNGGGVSGAFTDSVTIANVPAGYEGSQFTAVAFTTNPVCVAEGADAVLLVGDCPACAVPGDADGDEDIDLADFARFAACFGPAGGNDPGCACVNVRQQGPAINLLDYTRFSTLLDAPR
jgi:hypothetical protein